VRALAAIRDDTGAPPAARVSAGRALLDLTPRWHAEHETEQRVAALERAMYPSGSTGLRVVTGGPR
jgi:hypothetical protein